MKRSLVLAGGGMRVAWQAGVMKALEEEGLVFDHVDGTSGGIMTAGMALSGLDADEMIDRWGRIHVADFSSALPLGDYLKGPWALPAASDADGIIEKIFPALGIDIERVRSRASGAPEGTFTVADFTRKSALAIDASEIDLELMAAGMSLPIFTTPLHRNGVTYTDAVWIRDANVAEALRRGADEVWLVWCIGNTAYWGDGPLEQYVHMIEMSATGALLADFALADASGRTFVLHVIKPRHPLPLDPEFYLGRISARTFAAMGYRDAIACLESRTGGGVPHDHTATQMTDAPVGVRWNERLRGTWMGAATGVSGAAVRRDVELELTVELPSGGAGAGGNAVAGGAGGGAGAGAGVGAARVTGFVSGSGWEHPQPLADGSAALDGDLWTYRARVRVAGEWQNLTLVRNLHDDPGWDAWSDATTATLRIGDDRECELTIGVADVRALLASIEPVGAHGLREHAAAIGAAVVTGFRELLHVGGIR